MRHAGRSSARRPSYPPPHSTGHSTAHTATALSHSGRRAMVAPVIPQPAVQAAGHSPDASTFCTTVQAGRCSVDVQAQGTDANADLDPLHAATDKAEGRTVPAHCTALPLAVSCPISNVQRSCPISNVQQHTTVFSFFSPHQRPTQAEGEHHHHNRRAGDCQALSAG